jgi:hypothetical protein
MQDNNPLREFNKYSRLKPSHHLSYQLNFLGLMGSITVLLLSYPRGKPAHAVIHAPPQAQGHLGVLHHTQLQAINPAVHKNASSMKQAVCCIKHCGHT